MSWHALQLNLPQGLLDAGQTVSQGINAVKTAIQAVEAEIRVEQALVTNPEAAAVQATNAAITAIVTSITNLVNAALDTSGIYLLHVPLPKKGVVRLLSGPNDMPNVNTSSFPSADMLLHLPQDILNNVRNSPSFTTLFNENNLFVGGNAYFLQTIANSLSDAGDRNRPQFDTASYWAYSLILGGASDITTALSAASMFSRLFEPSVHANQVRPDHGLVNVVPHGLSIQPSGRGHQPILSWQAAPASATFASFDNTVVSPIAYAIIRSTDFRARAATHVHDLFVSNDLSVGMTGQFGAEVIDVLPYIPMVNRYVDQSALLPDTPYFYHVAFKTRMGTADPTSQTVEYPFDLLSPCVEFRLPRNPRQMTNTTLSVAPDWIRTPSIPAMFPPLDRFLDQVLARLDSLKAFSQSTTELNNAYLTMLDNQIASLTSHANEINLYLGQMSNIFSAPTAGIYATLKQGHGNIFRFLADVVQTLDDSTDPESPPFHNGDEYVTGVVLLAVGPDPAPVLAAFNMLAALFGPASQNEALAGVNAVKTAANATIAAVAQEISSQAFGPDMKPLPPGTPDAAC